MTARRWILVRHAPALPRDFARWPDDTGRPLEPAGKKEFKEAARGIADLLTQRGHLISSPLVRAQQTAELLSEAWHGIRVSETWPELSPEGSNVEVFRKAKSLRGEGDLVLVGHEPQLSRMIGYCLAGDEFSAVRFSKGGAVAVDFPGAVRPGAGRILWVLTRGQARRLRPRGSKSRREE